MVKVENSIYICSHRAYATITANLVCGLENLGYDTVTYLRDNKPQEMDAVVIPNILAHAHFVVMVTANMLFRTYEPNYAYRRQIETAIEHQRNIIPLMFPDAGFDNPHVVRYLHASISSINQHNPIFIDTEGFDRTVRALQQRLQEPTNVVLAADVPALPDPMLPKITSENLQAEYHYERGNAHYLNNEYATAKEELNKAITLHTDFSEAFNNRGLVQRHLGDLDAALSDLHEAIRLNPDEPAHYSNRALVYSDLERHEDALINAQKAIELAPEMSVAYNNRGIALRGLDRIQESIDDFTHAIELEPNEAMIYSNRALSLEKIGDVEGALADYEKAIELIPNIANAKFARIYDSRGLLHEEQGNDEQAKADYKQAIEINPDYPHSYNHLALLHEKEGNTDVALENYRKAVQLSPNNAVYLVNRANLYIRSGQKDEALKDIEKALSINDNYAPAYHSRGILRVYTGQLRSAIADFTRAIELKPDVITYANRAIAYERQENWGLAREDWYAALELDPDFKPAHQGLDLLQRRENSGCWPLLVALIGDGSKKKK